MKQVIVGGYFASIPKTLTGYNTVAGGFTWATAVENMKQAVSTPGTLSNLLIELSAAPGNGNSYTITLMINGAATGLAVTISGTDTTGLNAGSVAVVAGDVIQLRSTYSGTPASSKARWSILFEGTNANESLILGTTKTNTTAIRYSPIMHGDPSGGVLENFCYQIIPTSGKIKNLYVALDADPGDAPDAYRFTLRVNGANSDDGAGNPLQVTITADDTIGNDTAHEITVAVGDYVDLMIEPLDTPSAAPRVRFGFTFVTDTDGEFLLLGQSSDTPTTTQTEYNYLVSTTYPVAWITTESQRYQGGQPMTLKKLYVRLSNTPGIGKSYLIGVRVNGSTRIAVTIADAATTGNNVADTWDVANFDDLNMVSTPDGTPTAIMVYWGLVGFIAPPAPPYSPATRSANMGSKMVAAGMI